MSFWFQRILFSCSYLWIVKVAFVSPWKPAITWTLINVHFLKIYINFHDTPKIEKDKKIIWAFVISNSVFCHGNQANQHKGTKIFQISHSYLTKAYQVKINHRTKWAIISDKSQRQELCIVYHFYFLIYACHIIVAQNIFDWTPNNIVADMVEIWLK
jgi:hypothetical protein